LLFHQILSKLACLGHGLSDCFSFGEDSEEKRLDIRTTIYVVLATSR
jgi:hypothetical protein